MNNSNNNNNNNNNIRPDESVTNYFIRMGIEKTDLYRDVNLVVALEALDKAFIQMAIDFPHKTNLAYSFYLWNNPLYWQKILDKKPPSPKIFSNYAISFLNAGIQDILKIVGADFPFYIINEIPKILSTTLNNALKKENVAFTRDNTCGIFLVIKTPTDLHEHLYTHHK